MTLKDLLIKIGFQVDHNPLEKVEKQLEGIKNRLEFLAAAEVIKGIVELTERFSKFAEELHVAAESAGLTVEAFQRLSFAAGKSNISSEEMGMSMARLGRQLYQARMGGEEAQKAFQQAGFSGDQIKGFHTASDAMLALADRFKNIQDPIQKQALAMQLMGRGSVNMVAFLSQGSGAIRGMGVEANKLGVVLGHDQVNALIKVEHAMYELFAVFKAVGATIASYFAPSIETAIKDFLKFYEVNKKLIDTNIREWVYDLTYALGFVYGIIKFVVQGFFDFAKAHETLVRRASEFLVILGVLTGVIWLLMRAVSFAKGAFEIWQTVIRGVGSALQFINANPIILAIGLLVVAIHDLWEVAHGRPGWVNQFLAFIGIAPLVEDFMDVVFELISALMHLETLDFSGLLKDFGMFSDTISSIVGNIKSLGGKALSFLGFGSEGGGQAAAAAVQNLNAVPGLGGVPASVGGATTSSQNYQVNAPVNITVPPGTDPKVVGQKVQDGIAQHLDTVYRRTQQAFTPAVSY